MTLHVRLTPQFDFSRFVMAGGKGLAVRRTGCEETKSGKQVV